jgi:hypothetical protein
MKLLLERCAVPRNLNFALLVTFALLTACSDDNNGTPAAEAGKVTQTRMNDIDSLEGTISDEMIITDDANDEAALEPEAETKTLPGKPETKPAAPKPADASGDTVSDETASEDAAAQ